MACGLRHPFRRDSGSEYDEHAKPQFVPTTHQKPSLLKAQSKSARTSLQHSSPTAADPRHEMVEPSSLSSTINNPTNKPDPTPLHDSASSATVVGNEFFALFRKWLQYPKSSFQQHHCKAFRHRVPTSSTGTQAAEPKSSDRASDHLGMQEPQSQSSSSSETSVPHLEGRPETPSLGATTESTIESLPWDTISKDNLKRMEANEFTLTSVSGFGVKVDKPDKFPDDWDTNGNIWFGFSRLDAKGPPGLGPGSIGINRNEGGLYYNNERIGNLQNFEFESGVKIGIGIVFSYVDQRQDSDSAIEVRFIHTRQGVLVDNVHVDTLVGAREEGFDGCSNLFAAVGTVGRVVFEILFEDKFWSFKPWEHGVFQG